MYRRFYLGHLKRTAAEKLEMERTNLSDDAALELQLALRGKAPAAVTIPSDKFELEDKLYGIFSQTQQALT